LQPGQPRTSWIRTAGLLALCAVFSAGAATKTTAKARKVSRPATTATPAPKPKPKPAEPAPAPVATVDTTVFGRPISDSATVGVRIYEYIAYPTLQLVTWPVQNILAPGVELLTYPSQEPMRYFLEENVIDRSLDLFSGGRDDNVRVYPTISLASGTASRVGAVLRDEALFRRDTERLVATFNYYVNGDFRLRSYLVAKELGGTDFTGKAAFALNRVRNTAFYQPDINTLYYYANSSESYSLQLDYPLVLGFFARGGFALVSNRFGESPANMGATVSSEFFRDENGVLNEEYRGLNESFFDRGYKVGLVRDTRNNPNIPVDGSWTDITAAFHDASDNHDYYEWTARFTKFFKLGRERYEVTADEEKKDGGLNMEEFIRKLEYQRLRQQFFSRKVVVAHLYAARSYEIAGNTMPVYGLQSLGNATPLRGYPGSRYRNYSVVSGTLEYRFPILRLMDGTLFNEYGMFGKALDEPDLDNLRNSWGFGIRVRRPDMFLFRIEIAFHGFSGIGLNASADAPF
jgi:hypothetical protein